VGISLMVVGLMSSAVQGGLAGRAVKMLGEFRSLMLGLGAMAVAMLGYGLAWRGEIIFAIIVIGSIGGVGSAAGSALMSKAVGPSEQGALQGTLSSISSVASIVGPLLWTWLYQISLSPVSWLGGSQVPGLPFIGASVVTVLSILTALWLGRGFAAPSPLPAETQPTL
jgi:MFS transporter, DHA1 family, tetracycline resistance protein